MNSVTPICCFRSNRILSVQPKHTTRCHRLHNRKNSLPLTLCFFWSSSTQWILSSTSIPVTLVLYVVTQGSNPFTTNSRERERLHLYQALLGNWCQRGRERSHQSLSFRERSHQKIYHLLRERERERSPGGENTSRMYFSRIPDAWCSRGEMPHVFLRGKDMFVCAYLH